MKRLAQFIRGSREAIVAAWLTQVARLPSATGQPYGVLRNHIPQILDQLATTLAGGDAEPQNGVLDSLAGAHAMLRFHAGYDLRQIVLEYQALRSTILALYQQETPTPATIRPVAALDLALDEAIGDAVDRYTDERDRARDVFVGILGHDLRNPLQSIAIGAGSLMARRAELDPKTISVAAVTERSAKRMEELITDLLDFARARLGGGIPIAPVSVDLCPVVDAVVEELIAAHPERSIQRLATAGLGDFVGEWDPARLAQAVSNLVGNAIEHGEDPIVVEPFDDGAIVRIEVRNRGEIPAEIRPTLFKPFHHGHSGTGLGLGLYVVDEIARAHGGRVDVASDETNGTRITLVLPRRPELSARPS